MSCTTRIENKVRFVLSILQIIYTIHLNENGPGPRMHIEVGHDEAGVPYIPHLND